MLARTGMGELEWLSAHVVVHIVDDVLGLRAFPGDGLLPRMLNLIRQMLFTEHCGWIYLYDWPSLFLDGR